MILADKIIDLRKKAGFSQEELAEKMNVSRQAVSKWESAQSVPDLNRILKMSEIFGVSTDYLLKDEMEEPEYIAGADERVNEEGVPLRKVSMAEADSFLEKNRISAKRIAVGVFMCICSPILLIGLCGWSELGGMKENTAACIGLIVLFLLIAGAVALFLTVGQLMEPFGYLEKEQIETEYGVAGMVKERKQQTESSHTRDLIIGIVLCILAVIPSFASELWNGGREDMTSVLSVCVMLLIIAIGVYFIVRTCVIWGGFQKLLEEGDYARDRKKAEPIIGIFWMIVTAAYLAYSFITMDWARSWIIWPVAGVLCGILYEILKLKRK